jgi:ribosomal protein L7/L12
MVDESDVMLLRARVMELESKINFLYRHFNLEYVKVEDESDQKVLAAFKKGGLIEAIKVYRELYKVDLGSAKQAVENLLKK